MLEFEKIGKYADKIIEQEEKEMGVKFDHYIKNIEAIDVITDFEMLPDEIKLQVRTKEDVHIFRLEGEGVKTAADRYTELKAENFRLHKEQDKLLEKIELLKQVNDKLKQDNYNLTCQSNALVLEHDSLLEKYKEQEAKIADLQIEKARLEKQGENFLKKNKYLLDKLGVKDAEYQTLKKEFNDLSKRILEQPCEQCNRYKALYEEFRQLKQDNDKNIKRNKELNKQIDEMVLNANKRKEEDAKDQRIGELEISLSNWKRSYDILYKALHDSQINCEKCYDKWVKMQEAAGKADYSLDSVVKALDKALNGFSERMDKLIKEFGDMFCEGELEVTTEETYEVKEADEEPSSRRDILRCAEKCVCGKREQDYGTPESNFKIIADLWNGYLGGRTDNPVVSITPVDVSMMMALLKIARIRNGGGTGDSFVDLAGYAACGGEINAQKKATETN